MLASAPAGLSSTEREDDRAGIMSATAPIDDNEASSAVACVQ